MKLITAIVKPFKLDDVKAALKDMGVPTSLIAASVNCVVAQRLVRRLCVDCREAYTASPAEQEALGVSEPVTIYRAKGCYRCVDTGFRGTRSYRFEGGCATFRFDIDAKRAGALVDDHFCKQR